MPPSLNNSDICWSCIDIDSNSKSSELLFLIDNNLNKI